MKIGAQLYSVREFTQNIQDFENTIKRIAAMGYDNVQVSGIGPIAVQDVADICSAFSIEIAITHTPLDRIINDTAQVIADHATMGAKYIGVGALPWGTGNKKEGYVNFVRDIAKASQAIKDAGYQFMYHNHDFEFTKFDGKTGMEYLMDSLPTAGFTLDTYWVQVGGGDPAFWIEKYAGRVDVIHIKDLVIVDGQQRMAEIYEGNLNWDAIFAAAKKAGVKYAMIEQDDCYGKDPFECLQLSLENTRSRGGF